MSPDSDLALRLIASGRMPPADSLTPAGAPAWTWETLCRAFQAEPNELAAILKPVHLETQHKAPIVFRAETK